MAKIYNAREMQCEGKEYRKGFLCQIKSKKGRIVNYGTELESAFLIKKPTKTGDNLIASGHTSDYGRHTTSFYDKKCAIVSVKPIMDVEGKKELIPRRKEMVCADSKSVLKKFIKENEGYF